MNIHISDMMIYVIAILSTIVVLIDLLRMERDVLTDKIVSMFDNMSQKDKEKWADKLDEVNEEFNVFTRAQGDEKVESRNKIKRIYKELYT